MSGCILVIYGAVLPLSKTQKDSKLRSLAEDWVGPGYLAHPYSGNGESPYIAGVVLAMMRQYSFPVDGYEIHQFEPTKAQKEEAARIIAGLPEEIRAHLIKVGRYVIPCP